MKKWEYKHVFTTSGENGRGKGTELLIARMNEAGEQGWREVFLDFANNEAVMEREIPEPSTEDEIEQARRQIG